MGKLWKKFNVTDPAPKLQTVYLLHQSGQSGFILAYRALNGGGGDAYGNRTYRKWADAAKAAEKLDDAAGWCITEIQLTVMSKSFTEEEDCEPDGDVGLPSYDCFDRI